MSLMFLGDEVGAVLCEEAPEELLIFPSNAVPGGVVECSVVWWNVVWCGGM